MISEIRYEIDQQIYVKAPQSWKQKHVLYSTARLKSVTLMINMNKITSLHYKRADIMQAKESKTRRKKKKNTHKTQVKVC